MRVLQAYIWHYRPDVHDQAGRQPLIASTQGRPQVSTLRQWTYLATHPCKAEPFPHDHERATCEYRSFHHSSKCPRARSPHHVRTGSITWHRDCGWPPDALKERVNASQRIIDRYYDQATARERMERGRRPYLDELGFDEEGDAS